MVLRDLQRAPLRLALSALGVGFAVGILHLGRFGTDSIRVMLDRHFGVEQARSWRSPSAIRSRPRRCSRCGGSRACSRSSPCG